MIFKLIRVVWISKKDKEKEKKEEELFLLYYRNVYINHNYIIISFYIVIVHASGKEKTLFRTNKAASFILFFSLINSFLQLIFSLKTC